VTATLTELDLAPPPEPIFVFVEGRPAPKGSRIAGRTKSGKGYTYPASVYEKGWVAEVTHEAKLVMRHRQTPEPPYEVDLTFYLKPSKRPKWPWPTVGDIDKYARAVIDGLVKGGCMSDDRHVCALTVRKQWADDQHPMGVIAEIRPEQGFRLSGQ
jgi:Holliday junction resolvase RusA-like endonuclease